MASFGRGKKLPDCAGSCASRNRDYKEEESTKLKSNEAEQALVG